jgi:rhomboid protease GluP
MSDQLPQPGNQLPHDPVRVKMPDQTPFVTYLIMGVTAIFFIFQYLTQSVFGNDILFIYGGKINQFIRMGQFWRLFTPALLHGSIMHIAFNLYALYIIGRGLENFYGHGRFLILYALSAFAGNVLSFVLSPAPSLGASTAIFGLLAAQGMFIFQNRKIFGPGRTRQAMLNMGMILFINLTYGFMPGTNIDNMGHIGGLLGGIFFAWKAGPIMNITGQPPFFDMVDVRQKHEILLAGLVVLIGFAIIAAIPFLAT